MKSSSKSRRYILSILLAERRTVTVDPSTPWQRQPGHEHRGRAAMHRSPRCNIKKEPYSFNHITRLIHGLISAPNYLSALKHTRQFVHLGPEHFGSFHSHPTFMRRLLTRPKGDAQTINQVLMKKIECPSESLFP
jgi:hypothetical protein